MTVTLQNEAAGGGVKPLILQIELSASPQLVELVGRVLAAFAPPAPAPVSAPVPVSAGAADMVPVTRVHTPPSPPPVGPPPKAAPPPAPGVRVDGRWTAERKAVLGRDYPTARPGADILLDILALPGAALTWHQAASYARNVMRLSRPRPEAEPAGEPKAPGESAPPVAEVPASLDAEPPPPTFVPAPSRVSATDVPQVSSDARAARPPRPGSLEPVPADYATIHAWAAVRGLAPVREGMDLNQVNRKRVELGLSPFELRGRARAA